MIRTQILLTEEQARILKRLSRERKQSVAELIRQSIDLYLTTSGQSSLEQRYAKALALAGQFASGDVALGRRHDDFLTEASGGSICAINADRVGQCRFAQYGCSCAANC